MTDKPVLDGTVLHRDGPTVKAGTEALRKAVAAAIFDPGATEGYKGERTLTEWQVDAVMRALAQPKQPALGAGEFVLVPQIPTDAMVQAADAASFGWPRHWARHYNAMLAVAPAPPVQSQAAKDVLAERLRQVEAEGWTPAHDDEHENGEIAAAAVCYAFTAVRSPHDIQNRIWPWQSKWWKPTNQRRNLVKAAALILAEIERRDRASNKVGKP